MCYFLICNSMLVVVIDEYSCRMDDCFGNYMHVI